MRRYLYQQEGVSSILAIISMVMFGIFLAGILPYVSTLTKASINNIDVLQAQYAAEAGAKRALVSLDRNAANADGNDWSWLDQDCNLTANNDAVSYNVMTIMQLNPYNNTYSDYVPPANAVIPTGKYKIKSVGKVKAGGKILSSTVYLIAVVTINNNVNRVDFKSLGWSK